MSTRVWSAAALVGLCAAAVAVVETQEPMPVDADSPRVVRHGEMSGARAVHQATLLGSGEVLVTGGCDTRGCENYLASAELYDPATRSFRPLAPMATPRRDHAAALLPDGRVLVAGGWKARRVTTASAEVYDPATGRWTSAGRMADARGRPVAVPLPDGRVLVLGGRSEAGAPLASAEVFDPATSTFTAVGPMRTPRFAHAAVALADGRVLVTGGEPPRDDAAPSAELFDPSTNRFHPTGEMTVPRMQHAAALLPDGRVLLIGGANSLDIGRDRQGRLTTTEIYDPATGRFSPGPGMRWPRHKIQNAVAVFPSGAVLVAGGSAHPEIWEPAAKDFAPVQGELEGRHEFATATLLRTGDVLVLGGYDVPVKPSAAVWLVSPAH